MQPFRSSKLPGRQDAQLRLELRVFAWNLRSVVTPFEQQSLALNTIERGRAWHWRLLPAGWAHTSFILRHGQLKTKRAFARFFPSLNNTEIRPPKRPMRIRKPAAGEAPLAWEKSKHIPGLKVAQFADLLDAKISALSTRGFARDVLDLFAAQKQRQLNWRGLLIKASRNQLNDYNPIELENNLKLLELELEKGTEDVLPCAHPPPIRDLKSFWRNCAPLTPT